MSADNWAVCPRCERKRQTDLGGRLASIGAAYGTVPVDEFDRMRAEYDEAAKATAPATFREDYEIYGAEDGAVTVAYSGVCKECGLSLKINETHPIPGLDASP